jgi:hypothetical protein
VVGRLLPYSWVHLHDYRDSFGLDTYQGAEYNTTYDAMVLRGLIRNTHASFVRIFLIPSSLLPFFLRLFELARQLTYVSQHSTSLNPLIDLHPSLTFPSHQTIRAVLLCYVYGVCPGNNGQIHGGLREANSLKTAISTQALCGDGGAVHSAIHQCVLPLAIGA